MPRLRPTPPLHHILLAALCLAAVSRALAQNQTPAPARSEFILEDGRPFDHGDKPNLGLMHFAKLKQVPENPPARPLAPLELKDKIYHGVLLNTDTQSLFDQRYEKYVAVAGAKPSMIGCFAPLWSKGVEQPPDMFLRRLRTIASKPGVVPVMRLATGDWQPSGPFLKADDILSGKEDARFIRLAEMSREFGRPYLLSINHEMNGDWFHYSELFKRQPTDWTAEKFKLVWRRIHKLFRDHGADQVAFLWSPGVNGRKFGKYDSLNSYKAYYPGDDVVDWIGASVYNDVNPYALDNLAATYPDKPLMLGEWGTEPHRGEWYSPKPYPGDAAWMERIFEFVKRYPNMKAITYFYWGKDVDIERVPAQVDIYRRGVADPAYLSLD